MPAVDPAATDRRRAAARRAYAHHEAGHAIAAAVFSWTIRRVSIVPDDQRIGLMDAAPVYDIAALAPADQHRARRQRVYEGLIVTLAGPAAQRQFSPRSRIPGVGRLDYEKAAQLACILASSARGERALIRFAEHEADALVSNEWPAVAVLADALIEHDELTGDQVGAILEPVHAERARASREALATGISDTEIDQHEAERHRRARRVERRDIAAAVLSGVIDAIATGHTAHLTERDAVAAAMRHAERHGLDADLAGRKLQDIVDDRRARLRWRAVA